ncbi:MAG: hypothetical protein OXI63_17070 [Candidatus Poribacteria bacterium]|nr:hypothetical protein [Candidatus Poribacteria bacterium]
MLLNNIVPLGAFWWGYLEIEIRGQRKTKIENNALELAQITDLHFPHLLTELLE